jgi:Rrf2 family protein
MAMRIRLPRTGIPREAEGCLSRPISPRVPHINAGGRDIRRSSIMNVGRRVDYAIRALCYLAAQPANRVVPRAEIQERQSIPPHFLSKILRTLVGAGFLASVPGARGGFRLGRPAHDISVRAVYESVEGQLSLIECVDQREGFCCFAPVCTQIEIWRGAQQLLNDYLEHISIGDIADHKGLVPRLRQRSPRGLTRTPKVA